MYGYAMDRERAAEIYEDGVTYGEEQIYDTYKDHLDLLTWITEKLGFDTTVGGLDPKTGILREDITPLDAWLNAWRMRSTVEEETE